MQGTAFIFADSETNVDDGLWDACNNYLTSNGYKVKNPTTVLYDISDISGLINALNDIRGCDTIVMIGDWRMSNNSQTFLKLCQRYSFSSINYDKVINANPKISNK